MRATVRLALALVMLAALLSACSPPGFRIRDDYMGKRWFEPRNVPARVQHDELGNPVLPGN